MVELIVSGSVIVILAGLICTLVERRIDRLEDKVDWLLKKAGNDYIPKKIRNGGDGNGAEHDDNSTR